MTPATHALLSGALTFGVPLALGAYELIALRRAGKGPGRSGNPRDPALPPPLPRGEPCPPPLPACLIEAARIDLAAGPAERERTLEPA